MTTSSTSSRRSLGAVGYVHKSVADRGPHHCVPVGAAWRALLYPGAVATPIRDYLGRGREANADATLLTPREEEVLKLIAEGHSGKEIADLS